MSTLYKRGGKQNKNGTWYIQYFDETGRRRTVRGCKDKEATQQIARKFETDVALRKARVIDAQADRYAREGQRPIREHLEEWKKDLHSRAVSERQVRAVYQRCVRVFHLAGMERLSEITAYGVQNALGQLREMGRAAKTLNDILASVKQFCRWARRE
ncbi:MAG TPA: site-specific integrase [bacterium]|nr:site-specific integrase [bacterium]